MRVRDLFYEAHRKFKYDPAGGELRYRSSRNKAGRLSGEGFVVVDLGGRPMSVHRVVWLMRFGYLPKGRITHINKDGTDNRLSNLRAHPTKEEKKWGGVKIDARDLDALRDQIPGVSFLERSKLWRATLTKKNREVEELGVFKTFEEAVYARFYAEMKADWLGTETPSPAEMFVVNSGMLDGYLLSYS